MGDWAFQYDTLNRLTAGAPANNGPSTYAASIGCWGYDSFGNRTLASFVTSGDCTGANTATASYTANNQVNWTTVNSAVNGFTYDKSGNVYNDNVNAYAHDAEGRLCAVDNGVNGVMTQYLYDAEGLRVGKATFTAGFPAINVTCAAPGAATGFVLTKQYLLDQSGDQVTELNGSGTWQHSNIWSGSHLDATYDLDTKSSSPALHFQLADPLGTRRVQTNPSGQVEEDCQSLPFGDGLNCVKTSLSTADDATEHHFTGKERDTESNTGASQTGLDYFGARYYESTMGQWMSPDTDFNLKRILGTPQRWNRYAYVINNPLGRIDPDGNRDVSIVVVRSDPSATPSHGANPVTATTGQYRFQVNGRTLDTGYTIERGGDLRIPSGNYEGKPVQRGATDVHAFVELEGVHDPQNSDRVMTNVEGHLGNFPWDSKGCILFGADLSETTQAYDKYDLQNHSSMMVTDSTNTAIGLQDMMQDVINTDRQNNEPTNIDFEIIDPPIDTVPAPPFPAGGANQHVPS